MSCVTPTVVYGRPPPRFILLYACDLAAPLAVVERDLFLMADIEVPARCTFDINTDDACFSYLYYTKLYSPGPGKTSLVTPVSSVAAVLGGIGFFQLTTPVTPLEM